MIPELIIPSFSSAKLLLEYKFLNNLVCETSSDYSLVNGGDKFSYVSDRHGNEKSALNFNGATSMRTNSSVNLSGINKISFSFWFKNGTSTSSVYLMATSQSFTSNGTGLQLNANVNDLAVGKIANFDSYSQGSGIVANYIFDKNWHHIAATVDRSISSIEKFKLWVDGQIIESYSINSWQMFQTQNFGSDFFYLANRGGGAAYFTIAELKVFSGILQEYEIKTLSL